VVSKQNLFIKCCNQTVKKSDTYERCVCLKFRLNTECGYTTAELTILIA